MLKNYLVISIRNLKRNKSYTLINVLGLAIGISAALVVATILYNEASFNSYHTDQVTNVHRVVCQVVDHDDVQYTATVPHPLGNALRSEYPELEAVTMMYAMGDLQVNIEDEFGLRKFKGDAVGFADNDIFKILHFDWVTPINLEAISNPNSVVISTKLAEKYFNITSNYQMIVGKTIRMENQKNLVIKGVYVDFPKTTDFPFQLIANYHDQDSINRYFGKGKLWGRFNGSTNCFVKLNEHSKASDFEANLVQFLEKQQIMDGLSFKLQPLEELHFDERYFTYSGYTFDDSSKLTLTLIGLFLLVIACINFVNLSTAQSVNRSKEVGIRKVMGSERKNLIGQFMIETLCIVLMAHVLALGLAEIWFELISSFMDVDLGLMVFSTMDFVVYFLLSIAVTSLLAGTYPSLVISSFSPLDALRIKLTTIKSRGGLSLRRTLVILQFVVTQTIIIGTIVVMYQFDFLLNKELGFNKDDIVSIVLPKENRDKVPVFITELERMPQFEVGSRHLGSPIARTTNTDRYYASKLGKDNVFRTNVKSIDEKYLELFGIKLIAGRNLSKNENEKSVLINEKAVLAMGIDDPQEAVGEELASEWGNKLIVKGVVSDFNSASLKESMVPVFMVYDADYFDEVAVKLNSSYGASRMESIALIESEWDKIWPKHIMDYDFVDDALQKGYHAEKVMTTLFKAFSFVSIIISCLGIYGLIDFMANKKKKEIGIRKVLGASILNILNIFSKEIVVLLIVSFAISAPLVYLAMTEWLQSFAYQINIGFGMLLSAFTISLVLTVLTISYRSIRASHMNPVISLKDE